MRIATTWLLTSEFAIRHSSDIVRDMSIAWRTAWIGILCFTLIGMNFAAQFYPYLHSFGCPVAWGQMQKWMVGSLHSTPQIANTFCG